MKIVRLTENKGTTAYFDNIFNDEIELPPFSEVALSSVSVNVDPRTLEINSNTDEIAWKINGTIHGMDLDNGIYDETNYNTLLGNIHGLMNSDTDPRTGGGGGVSPECGLQWVASADTKATGLGAEGKMTIGYQVANYEGAAAEAFKYDNVTAAGGTGIAGLYSRDTGGGDGDSTMASKEPLGWGGSRFYVNLHTITDSGDPEVGVVIGLTTIDHNAKNTYPVAGEGVIEIGATKEGDQFFVSTGEVAAGEDTGPVIAAGQMIGFERVGTKGGFIEAVMYDAAGSRTLLTTIDAVDEGVIPAEIVYPQYTPAGDDINLPLYPYVIFFSPTANVKINQVQFSPDPYEIIKNTTYKVTARTTGTRGVQNAGVKTTGYLDFKTYNAINIGQYLGYTLQQISDLTKIVDMAAPKFGWTGKTTFSDTLKGQGFYVELMTGTCEGYDGQTGQRKNILAVIPESDSDDKILFQPAFPTFLELNNSHSLVLRNIRTRLLQTDGSSLGVNGMNSMTLLFKPGKTQ